MPAQVVPAAGLDVGVDPVVSCPLKVPRCLVGRGRGGVLMISGVHEYALLADRGQLVSRNLLPSHLGAPPRLGSTVKVLAPQSARRPFCLAASLPGLARPAKLIGGRAVLRGPYPPDIPESPEN
jgi:hypothetical protein